jgi:hypothetical protein
MYGCPFLKLKKPGRQSDRAFIAEIAIVSLCDYDMVNYVLHQDGKDSKKAKEKIG